MGRGPAGEPVGDVAVEGLAVGDEVLELAGRGVAGPDQDEQPLPLARRDLDERRDAVAAEVGVDGDRVGVPARHRTPPPTGTLPR